MFKTLTFREKKNSTRKNKQQQQQQTNKFAFTFRITAKIN